MATTTRQMPTAWAQRTPCRQIPGYIAADGRMVCACCHRTVGHEAPTEDAR